MKNFLSLKLKCEKNGEGGLVVMDIETYKVIVSDRAKQMPGTHIRFMA